MKEGFPWRKWLVLIRPFSLTASLIPVLVGSTIAALDGPFFWWIFVASLVGSLAIQAGTNVINEYYDVERGVDRLDTPRASHVILKGEISGPAAKRGAGVFFAAALLLSIAVSLHAGPWIIFLVALGVAGGYYYTAPPLEYKYRALGVPMVFLQMGPLMVLATYLAQRGTVSPVALWASLPVGFLVAAILHVNDIRDIHDDSGTGVITLSSLMGRVAAANLYRLMILGAYLVVLVVVGLGYFPMWALLTLLTLPLARRVLRNLSAGIRQQGGLDTLDIATAQLHLAFGLLLSLSFLLGAVGTVPGIS